MRVSIEQNDCTGCGACPEYSSVFFMNVDGLAHVKLAEQPEEDAMRSPDFYGLIATVAVPEAMIADVIDAVEQCPGQGAGDYGCIYIHADEDVDSSGNVLPANVSV